MDLGRLHKRRGGDGSSYGRGITRNEEEGPINLHGELKIYTVQLFIGEDLFKVMEIGDIRSEIHILLPLARISWSGGEMRKENLSMATITHLVFDLEGVIQDGSHRVFRYQYKGGS